MSVIRMACIPSGTDLGTVGGAIGVDSDSVVCSAFRKPAVQTAFPTISDAFDTGTLTANDNGITVTTRIWREVGTAPSLGSGATLSASGLGGKWIEYSPDNGTTWSPPILVYMSMGMPAHHLVADADIVAIVPQDEVTHIAVASGDWSNPATWHTNTVPKNGAFALIKRAISVTYDANVVNVRLDRIRVDGTLTWATDQSTQMLVESVIGTRGSSILMGTAGNRLPAAYTATVKVSGKDYSSNSLIPTDINLSKDPGLWGRGIVAQGTFSIWDTDKLTWSNADPMEIGATSATLHKSPEGWAVGDEVVIFGTKVDYARRTATPIVMEDEIRTITAIDWDTNTISWSGGMVHAHKNQLAGSTRTDLYPKIMLHKGRNIRIESEVTSPVWRRGHTAVMHHHATLDFWGGDFVNLGRTDKSRVAGKKESGNFVYNDGSGKQSATLTAQSNLTARYPGHAHELGFGHMGARPIMDRVQVFHTPGWGIAHHACDADFRQVGIYDFWGSGLVAEQGNELGEWTDCLSGHSGIIDPGGALEFNSKQLEGSHGLAGDVGRWGAGFFMRGRAVRSNRNVAVSCPRGHTFYPRALAAADANMIFPLKHPKREYLDLKNVSLMNNSGGIPPTYGNEYFPMVEYPIIHFSDNESCATLIGMEITKQAPQQDHDWNVKPKRFLSWGFWEAGADIEYIGAYALDQFDCVAASNTRTRGIRLNANTYQVAIVNARIEGCRYGLSKDMASTQGFQNVFDSVNDPRWMEIGIDYVNCTDPKEYLNLGATVFSNGDDVVYIDADLDGTAVDYDLDPTETFTLKVGVGNTATNAYTGAVGNADGFKVSNLNSTSKMAPKLWQDHTFSSTGLRLTNYINGFAGYHQYDFGAGSVNVAVQQDVISDPITGRPAKFTKLYELTNTPGATNNGTFEYSANPVVQSNKLATVAAGESVVVNVVTGATGGNGTIVLKDTMYSSPDHGTVTLNTGTGEITYTPDPGYLVGTDEMYVFVESAGRAATVRIEFLVGTGGAITTPVVDTDFSAVGGTGEIAVTLNDQPFTGGRRILLTQYSTDGGATWARLCNGWKKAIHKVTLDSDGTSLNTGARNIRIRYKTDYDRGFSTPSGDDAVTVS